VTPENFVPWEKYPELTQERLCMLASVIRAAREGAVQRHDPTAGDGPWGLGCSAHERTQFAIKKAARNYSWLTITEDKEKPLRFAFAIGHVPFRIYRGDPEDPPSRYLAASYVELHEKQLALDFGVAIPADGILRIAVETKENGLVSNISVVEIDEAYCIIGIYAIPLDAADGDSTIPLKTPPVDLGPPTIEPLPKIGEQKKPTARNASES
jgi:hypothetical protein